MRSIGTACLLVAAVMLGGVATAQMKPEDATPANAGTPPETAVDSAKRRAQVASEAAAAGTAAREAFAAGRYNEAASLFARERQLRPGDYLATYNLACALSLAGDADGAAGMLIEAIEEGFCDLRLMQRDGAIVPLLERAEVARVVAQWPKVLEARRDANIKQAESIYVNGYATISDDPLRLTYRSGFDAKAFEEARAELSRLAAWADAGVLKGVLDQDASIMDPWVTVILPTPNDFTRWAVTKFGLDAVEGVSGIGGSYDHDSRQLVAMDLGSTLRHEFFHVLHWRDMDRRGQRHPIWVMEGLCSLVEDYDLTADGALVPATSWRTNIAKRMEKSNGLMPLEKFLVLPQMKFTGSRPLANYAQARALFLFLSDRGLLEAWYAAFTAGFDEEPTGRGAFEKVFGDPLSGVEAEFRQWLRAVPNVAEEIKPGMASLGIEVESGGGDGLRVIGFSRKRSEVKDLKLGDVITSVKQRPTRDMAELVRVLGSLKPGETVTVGFRRGKRNATAECVLIAK